jgi:hypothetical protein
MTTQSFNEELTARGWLDCADGMGLPVYCDSAGGERIQEITGGTKANNSVESGIDFINAKIERRQFFVCEKCTGVLSEIWDYCRDEAGEIVKVNDHFWTLCGTPFSPVSSRGSYFNEYFPFLS